MPGIDGCPSRLAAGTGRPPDPAGPGPVPIMGRVRVTLATDAGTPGWPNEDFAAVAPGAAVLLDGCTTVPRDRDTGCRHGVAWYARTLGTALLAGITAVPPVPLDQALSAAIAEVRSRHETTCDLASPATPAATVTAVREEPDGIGYLALSDSTVAAWYGGGHQPLIISDRHRPAAARPEAAAAAVTGTVGRDGLQAVALLSDGATRLTDHYGLLGWPGLLDLLADGGPAALIGRVRAAEDSDPDGQRWPRGKLRDDATALWWAFPG
jgi:hypothetical protein